MADWSYNREKCRKLTKYYYSLNGNHRDLRFVSKSESTKSKIGQFAGFIYRHKAQAGDRSPLSLAQGLVWPRAPAQRLAVSFVIPLANSATGSSYSQS